MAWFTVVGAYIEEMAGRGDAAVEGSSYVEWVQAADAEDAVKEARAMYEEREDSVVVAVFRGRSVDVLLDRGTQG